MKNNKLIAEFLGFQQTNIGWYDAEEVLLRAERDNTFDNLKFDTDWNWLMQVVEKIEGLGYRVEIVNSTSKIEPIITHSEYITKIEAVYNACVEFVKWYNDENNR